MKVIKFPGWKMSLQRELRRFVSMPVYIFISIILPVGFLIFFTSFFKEGLPQQLPIGVIDHDNSSLSRNVIRQMKTSQQTKVADYYTNFTEARKSMQEGKIFGFVDIPAHFQKNVMSGNQPKIEYYYNQAYFIAGSLILRDLGIMLNTISGGVNLQTRYARGQTLDESMGQIQAIVPEAHPIGNPMLNYSVYLSNILLPAMLQLIILMTIVYVIGIELKKSSSLKWLRVSGNSLLKGLIGKLLPYTVIFTCIGFFYEVYMFKYMHFPLNSSILWMLLNVFLLVIATESIAVFMIGLFPVLRDGLCFAGLYGILAFSYSGLVYPIEGMPIALQTINYGFPLRFFFKIYQNVALNGINAAYSVTDYLSYLFFLLLPLIVWKRLRNALVSLNYPKK